ncbi:hypothetical protein GCM10010341_40340 [Streptomyces noursei]|nr:hypothetical protein GCM10010341_40340 [Streptomyces noursei]
MSAPVRGVPEAACPGPSTGPGGPSEAGRLDDEADEAEEADEAVTGTPYERGRTCST